MRSLLVVLPVFLSFGCEEFRTSLLGITEDPVDAPVEVEQPGPLGCGDIDGTYAADALIFAAEDDPGVHEDYRDYPDYTITFDPSRKRFESMLVLDGKAHVKTGTWFVIDDRIVFEAPPVPGMAPGHAALSCSYDGWSLTLYGPVEYDFASDELEGWRDADLTMSLVRL